MSDSISRADAIRWVKTECNPYGKPTLDYDSGLKVIEHLKKMPSELPSTEAEWIPCSERLPEEGRYLVATTLSVFSPQILNYDADGEEWFYDGCKSMGVDVPCVIAWMPLPEPYREDGE